MPPLSRSEIDQLGRRLRDSGSTIEDLRLLEQVRSLYEEPLAEVIAVLVGLGLEPSSRSKTTGTIIEKLRRIPALRLSEMQDLAGTRAVLEMTRNEQDALVEQIAARFDNRRVVDRRARPSHGYRAVHVIVKVGSRPIEIQVRTRMQDLWAQIMERLADSWGRGIRYGEPPIKPRQGLGAMTRQEILNYLMELAELVDVVEEVRKEHDGFLEELRMSEHAPAAPRDMAALSTRLERLSTRIERQEQRARENLEALHDAISSRTLHL